MLKNLAIFAAGTATGTTTILVLFSVLYAADSKFASMLDDYMRETLAI